MIANRAPPRQPKSATSLASRLHQEDQQHDDDCDRRSGEILLADVLGTPYRASIFEPVDDQPDVAQEEDASDQRDNYEFSNSQTEHLFTVLSAYAFLIEHSADSASAQAEKRQILDRISQVARGGAINAEKEVD